MKKALFLVLFVSLFIDGMAQVYKSMLFDFGPSDVTNGNITPVTNGNYWNNITNTAGGITSVADIKNAATTVKISVPAGFMSNGIQQGGLLNPSGTLLKEFAVATATQDFFFTATSATITISGLNTSRGYIFKLFGSRNETEKRVTTYTLTGLKTFSAALQTSGVNLGGTGYNGNNSTIVVSDRIMPNKDGNITLNVAKTEGAFAYISAMSIEEVPFCSTRTPSNITFMGSSTPYGFLIPNNQGYVYQYDQLLKARQASGSGKNWTVKNISISGNNTISVLNRWDSDLVPLCNKYVVYALTLGNEGITTAGQTAFNQFRDNLQLLIAKARAEGMTPIVTNCYSRDDYGPTEYNFLKQMNLLIHTWDVPSVNLLGALDNGAGKWATGYTADASHPNYAGHQEFLYTLVPSLFDALDNNKPLPSIVTNTSLNLNSNSGYKLEFTGEEIVHSFTISYDINTAASGTLAEFNTQAGINNITLNNTGKLFYSSKLSAGITGSSIINNSAWYRVTLTHYYALGKTLLYVDNILQGSVNEKLVPAAFTLNNANAPKASYRNLYFYRSALNSNEVAELAANHLLKSSLEIYSPLDQQGVISTDPLINLAQSNNKIKKVATPTTGLVTIYADINYAGFSGGLSTGDYTSAQLQALGVKDNDITSLKVAEGYKAVLYFDDNFIGNSITITADQGWIGGTFNDQVSSIRVLPNGNPNLASTYYLKNKVSNMYVDLKNAGLLNGEVIRQSSYNGSDAQKFKFVHLGNGNYSIVQVASNKVVDVSGVSIDAGAQITQWDNVNGKNQHFILVDAGNGFVKMIAEHSGMVAEVSTSTEGEQLHQSLNTNQENSKWSLITAVTTSLEDAGIYSANINITPNPAHNSLLITADHDLKGGNITITDIMGQNIMNIESYNGEQINISHLTSGVYTISYSNNTISTKSKFLKY